MENRRLQTSVAAGRIGMALAAAAWLAGATSAAGAAGIPADHAERMERGLKSFQARIAPLLKENCVGCHGGEKTKGGFDLSNRELLLKGGDLGAVVVPFDAAASKLLKLVRHEEEPHMPEKKPQLPAEAVEAIAQWIEDGAPYEGALVPGKEGTRPPGTVTDEDRGWWAFRPLEAMSPPAMTTASADRSDVDVFLLAKAAGKGVSFSPTADRRTLARRAFQDLVGLPPSPEELEAFIKDEAPGAWDRLVDRLLDSPHHGERWGRHWLDVARFAESSGFEHDYDRPGAYHYRDFVIRALNADLPFNRFVQWQLAGDEYEPENPLALAATGFLGAGVFPTQITANEVERTRYDALDDMLSTTGSAFMGLTIGCARCHDHKYDPIPVEDYYRMLSTFTTTVRSVLDLDMEPEKTLAATASWEAEGLGLREELARLEAELRPAFERGLAEGAIKARGQGWTLLPPTNIVSKAGASFRVLEDGSALAEGANGSHEEYVARAGLPPGAATGLRLEALADPSMPRGGPGRADNGNFALSRIRVYHRTVGGEEREIQLTAPQADFEQNKEGLSIASSLDENPSTGWAVDPQFGKHHRALFVFAEPLAADAGGELVVKLTFEVNTRHNIGRPRLAVTGDPKPSLEGETTPAGVSAALAALEKGGVGALDDGAREGLFDWWKQARPEWREASAKVAGHLAKKPDGRTKVLVCVEGYPALRHHTQGADFFEETHLLRRGSTDLKAGVAKPGFLQVLLKTETEQWGWKPPEGARFSGRRRTLATWLTDPVEGAGALVARVAANRIWQHHFGRGIVETPNDFGKTGAPPSHPELLEWLAGELVRSGWSLKHLHRVVMRSAAYQQGTGPNTRSMELDPDNHLFMRRDSRRLEGEVIRDSMLAVSGMLDRTQHGPGTKDERSRRRSIYFTVKRSQLVGSMVAFDMPEPLVSQGARPTTTVAPQALLLMNGPQVREWSAAFAVRMLEGGWENAAKRGFLLALGRAPSAAESSRVGEFLEAQRAAYQAEGPGDAERAALADLGQVLFGMNEFAYEN